MHLTLPLVAGDIVINYRSTVYQRGKNCVENADSVCKSHQILFSAVFIRPAIPHVQFLFQNIEKQGWIFSDPKSHFLTDKSPSFVLVSGNWTKIITKDGFRVLIDPVNACPSLVHF